jgi:hypothetical protein
MKKARPVFLIAFVFALLALSPAGQAQTTRGRVEGTVTDESKAVVANATVTLANINTQWRVVRKTSATGLYVFDDVDPGNYTVAVEVVGFSKFVQENILVQTGGDVTVNIPPYKPPSPSRKNPGRWNSTPPTRTSPSILQW